jgi:hypothetical protein
MFKNVEISKSFISFIFRVFFLNLILNSKQDLNLWTGWLLPKVHLRLNPKEHNAVVTAVKTSNFTRLKLTKMATTVLYLASKNTNWNSDGTQVFEALLQTKIISDSVCVGVFMCVHVGALHSMAGSLKYEQNYFHAFKNEKGNGIS